MIDTKVSASEISDQKAANSDKGVSGADIDGASSDQKMVSEVFMENYNARLHKAFYLGDKNHDGYLTEVEISSALDSKSVTEPDKKILREFKEHFKEIAQAATDFEPRNALTKFDLNTVYRVSNELEHVGRTADRAREFAKENFSSIDKNGDGWLSEKELDKFIDKSDSEPRELGLFLKNYKKDITDRATGGNYLWRNLTFKGDNIKKSDLDGITVENMSRHAENNIYKKTHQLNEFLIGMTRLNYQEPPYFKESTRNGIRQFIDKTR